MSIPKKHFKETKRLLKKVDKHTISKWLLEQGYYPEQYVVPPTFRVKKFDLNLFSTGAGHCSVASRYLFYVQPIS